MPNVGPGCCRPACFDVGGELNAMTSDAHRTHSVASIPISPAGDAGNSPNTSSAIARSVLRHGVRSRRVPRGPRPDVSACQVTAPCHTHARGKVEQELDDRWWLGLRSTAVESVYAHKFTVVLKFGEGSALTIESDAYVRASRREPATPAVTDNEDGTVATSHALLSLIGQQVPSSVGFKTGAIRLAFESGALLTVPHDEQREAWQLTGPSGRTWVSLPGGGLATFPGDPS